MFTGLLLAGCCPRSKPIDRFIVIHLADGYYIDEWDMVKVLPIPDRPTRGRAFDQRALVFKDFWAIDGKSLRSLLEDLPERRTE